MAVCSQGEYGSDKGLITSMPIRCDGSNWQVVEGLELNEYSRKQIAASNGELESERDTVQGLGIL